MDYGASDAPLKPEALARGRIGTVSHGHWRRGAGGEYPGMGPGQFKLTGEVLGDIFLGKIKKWDDPAIKGLNPGLKLPSQAITVAHRSDGSGTTYIFTSYLTMVSPAWKEKVGAGNAVKWPAA